MILLLSLLLRVALVFLYLWCISDLSLYIVFPAILLMTEKILSFKDTGHFEPILWDSGKA